MHELDDRFDRSVSVLIIKSWLDEFTIRQSYVSNAMQLLTCELANGEPVGEIECHDDPTSRFANYRNITNKRRGAIEDRTSIENVNSYVTISR